VTRMLVAVLVVALGGPAWAGEAPLSATELVESGNARLKSGDYPGATADYAEAIRLDPGNAEAWCNRGVAGANSGDLARGIADFTEAIRLKPRYADAYFGRGAACAKALDFARAIADFSKVIRLKPDSAEAFCGRAAARDGSSDYAGAIADFTEAIRLKPAYAATYGAAGGVSYGNADAYCGRGSAHAKSGDLDQAIADFTDAIRLKPDFAEAFYNRGVARGRSGDTAGAIADFTDAIRLKPDMVRAYNNRGAAYTNTGDYAKAIPDYTEAIRLKPDYMQAYVNRSIAYAKSGDRARADADREQADRLAKGGKPVAAAAPAAGAPGDRNPPVITVTSPAPGEPVAGEEIVVKGEVRDDGTVSWVEVMGRRVAARRGISVEKKTGWSFSETVKLPPGETRIVVRAADESGNVADYAVPVVRGAAAAAAAAKPAVPGAPPGSKPDLYVLAIGVSKYASGRLSLQFADHDAESVIEALKGQQGKLYGNVFTQLLVNERVTRDTILGATDEFLGQASNFDVAMIFVAGHGVQNKKTSSYYFLPYDAQPDNLMSRGLRWSDFDEAVTSLRTHISKVILLVDTCHAGSMTVAMRGAETGEDLAGILRGAEGTFIISASTAGEQSEERDEWRLPGETRGHGAFTFALLRGLKGAADLDTNGSVSVDELSYFVGKEVPKLTGGKQHPYKRSAGTDMPLAVTPVPAGR